MNSSYLDWLDSLSSQEVNEEPVVLQSEIELQSHWYEGGFGLEFITTCGKPVVVNYLGEWNRGAGPDFKECVVTIDGVEHKGDIELDPTPAEWERHGHAVNPAFNGVLLHVSFGGFSVNSFCRTANQREVPQVHITEVPESLIKRTEGSLPGFCAEEFSNWSQGEVDRLLRASAHHRLGQKAERLSRQIKAVGLNETLWQSLATTIGYRPNAQAMRLLSQRLKADTIKNIGDHESRLAILLGTAGFLSVDLYEKAPQDTQDYLQNLWESWWRERSRHELDEGRSIPWTMHGQRPVNHPHRRVASLASLWSALHLILDTVKSPNQTRLTELGESLTSLKDEFWSRHYTLTSDRSANHLSLFGADKYRELISNFLVPIWYLTDQEAAFDYYTSIKSSSKNEQVKRSLERLFAQHPTVSQFAKYSYQQQGLQQLYHDFCLRHGCLRCPFPKIR